MSYTDSENPDKKYYELAQKLLNGSITPDEEADFSEWYNRFEDKPIVIPSTFARSEHELKDRIWHKINTARSQDKKKIKTRTFFYSAAAAAVLVVFLIVAYWYVPSATKKLAATHPINSPNKVLLPKDKAVLTLADGSHILLDDAVNGTLTEQGRTKVIKLKSGQLVYRSSGKDDEIKDSRFNTVSTPHGGQYQLVLPDGTVVWLNTTSSLRFPTAFTGKERRVELAGEAYFEVAKNKEMPFKVTVNDMEISVLGTHFNVMGYNEEKEVKATLLEGSVKITRGTDQAVLKPGEQASLGKEAGTLLVSKNVNLKQAIAWKDGNFYFEDARIETIMLQISRWYNIKILYKGAISNVGFSGIISRSKNLSQMIEILEAANRIHFTLQGNELIVIPN